MENRELNEINIRRVIGARDSTEEQELLLPFQRNFTDQPTFDFERTKTQEELEVIGGILENYPEFVRSYSGTPLSLTPDHFHIVDKNAVDAKKVQRTKAAASWFVSGQLIIIYSHNMVNFAGIVAHEASHAHAYGEFTLKDDNLYFTRLGLRKGDKFDPEKVVSPKLTTDRIFAEKKEGLGRLTLLDEALTQELAIRFGRRYFRHIDSLRWQYDLQLRSEKARFSYTDESTLIDAIETQCPGFYSPSYTAARQEFRTLRYLVANYFGVHKAFDRVFELFAKTYFADDDQAKAKIREALSGAPNLWPH